MRLQIIKNIIRRALVIFVISFAIFVAPTSIAKAQGVDIDLGVPSGDPIFEIIDMLPGDMEEREVTVSNDSGSPNKIFVKCEEVEELKDFSKILDMIVKKDGLDIYGGTQGFMTVEEFCEVAQSGLNLGLVNDGEEIIYTFKVTFPPESGNGYQNAKYVFDLIFRTKSAHNLVINEVYYLVDEAHGTDRRKDRNLAIAGNGANSTNIIDVRYRNSCFVVQHIDTNVEVDVGSDANSGGNSSSGNTGGPSSINTGNANAGLNINVFGGYNISYGACRGSRSSHNDEWVEVYNPTNRTMSLKNWGLIDNSGELTKINSNTRIRPGEFVLISRNSSTWRFWDEPRRTRKVRLGREIGDGLDNAGDHLYLVNPDGEEIDFTAWGDDTEVWNPAVAKVSLGVSMERISTGFDTDVVEDWEERTPPTPGE